MRRALHKKAFAWQCRAAYPIAPRHWFIWRNRDEPGEWKATGTRCRTRSIRAEHAPLRNIRTARTWVAGPFSTPCIAVAAAGQLRRLRL